MSQNHIYEILPDGTWEFFLDNSTLRTFVECEAKFYERNLRNGTGIVPKGEGSWSVSLGSWWSSVMELFYTAMQRRELTRSLAMEAALHCWEKHELNKFSQSKKFQSFGGPNGAVVMIGRYYDSFAELHQQNWRIIAVEKTFGNKRAVPVGCSYTHGNGGFKVFWTGKPDLFIEDLTENRLMPIDHKTRDRIDRDAQVMYKPHPQTAGYIFAGNVIVKQLGWDRKIDRCIINLAARTEPSDNPRDGKPKPRFLHIYPQYSDEEIEEWRQQVLLKVASLKRAIETDEFRWNESACHLYAGCGYRGIHSVKPSSRPVIIESCYTEAKPWMPYEEDE